jgi:hypothetical protein
MTLEKNSNVLHDEFNLREIVNYLATKKLLIIICSGFISLASIFYSLNLPNEYTSSAILTISKSSSGGGSSRKLSPGMSDLAGLAGIQVSSGGSASDATIAIEVIKSRDFFKHLLTKQNILPYLVAGIGFDENSQTDIYDLTLYDPTISEWKGEYVSRPPSYYDGYKSYSEMISIDVDKKSNLIVIYATSNSPKFSYSLLNLIYREINEVTRDKDLKESSDALDYLYKLLDKNIYLDSIEISVNELIEQQIKTQTLANVRKNYFITALDSPFLPQEKSGPFRRNIVLASTFIGFLLVISVLASAHIMRKD